MRRNVRAAALLHAQRGHVVGAGILTLDHVVRDDAILGRHEFGDGVAEGHAGIEGNVIFHDGDLAVLLRDDQVAGMGHHRGSLRRGNEEQVDGRFTSDGALGGMDVRAVLNESGIESAEGVALDIGVAAKVRFERAGVVRELRR